MKKMSEMGIRTPEQIRDDMLRDMQNAAIESGRLEPDVSPGSFDYIRATALSGHLSLIEANNMMLAEQLFLSGAVGEDLEERAAEHDIYRRPKSGSIGRIIITNSAPSPVATGAQLTGPTGLRFEVTTGGSFGNGLPIEIRSLDSGRATNLEAGTVLQWSAAPPFADPRVVVAPGGLVNGDEDETDEELRARVIDHQSSPPAESNAQAMVERAEKSTPAVQKAFAYAALLGPSTYALAVAASPTETNKSRAVEPVTVTNVVAPAVAGSHMDSLHPLVVSVVDETVDYLSIGLSLPAALAAQGQGTGGGWVNGQPWPPAEPAKGYLAKTGLVSSATLFNVKVAAEPIDTVSRISWVHPTSGRLYTATVVAHENSGTDSWLITLDMPFTGITAECVVWPASERQEAYVAALYGAFALMGPGEMSSQPSVLRRSARHPLPSMSFPYSLGATQLRALSDSGPEVLAAQYLGTPTRMTPTVNGSAPRILVPKHFGFYPIP